MAHIDVYVRTGELASADRRLCICCAAVLMYGRRMAVTGGVRLAGSETSDVLEP